MSDNKTIPEVVNEMLDGLAQMYQKPIPTRTRLPQVGDTVMIFVPSFKRWEIAMKLDGDSYEIDGEYLLAGKEVTHWMELPPAPTSETP